MLDLGGGARFTLVNVDVSKTRLLQCVFQATHGETSASLLFFLRVSGLSEMFVIFMGVQPSPHSGVTTLPTMRPRGTHLEVVGSTITVLPGDLGTLLGSLPHSRYSCLGRRVTA